VVPAADLAGHAGDRVGDLLGCRRDLVDAVVGVVALRAARRRGHVISSRSFRFAPDRHRFRV
jgi:hypothetical protein